MKAFVPRNTVSFDVWLVSSRWEDQVNATVATLKEMIDSSYRTAAVRVLQWILRVARRRLYVFTIA